MTPPTYPEHARKDLIAYYCMEFGLSEHLPIYSGGLGILAGDILKAAKDAELPMVGIGIFWSEGYCHQVRDERGQPRDGWLPTPRGALRPTGVEVSVRIRDRDVAITAWRVDSFGNAPLYLLEPVDPHDRWVSRRLYGGNADDRVAQEILLGVGGVRVLRALGLDVSLHHFNEGHAVFAGIELLRERMARGANLHDALADVERHCIFTTHTPVPAGNEVHEIGRLEYQGLTNHTITTDVLQQIGGSPFEMTPAALKLASQANAVAELHGRTAQGMWAHVRDAAPIHAITNGVHLPTWQCREIARLHDEGAGDGALWAQHMVNKQALIDEIGIRTGVHLDPDILLIGFARRAATYKRATLVLQDLEWLTPLMDDGAFQIVFSGKAHPADEKGKALIRRIHEISQRFPHRIVFLDDYDMETGRLLTRGCDVWLNNPRRPNEASGTSGMKAAANGCLNLSILDGWWDEGCEHLVNGWGFGDRLDAYDEGDDHRDLVALQKAITEWVLPTYADRARWVEMMRASIHTAETRFGARHMISRYETLMYGPVMDALHHHRAQVAG